jgi:hypothetical protein
MDEGDRMNLILSTVQQEKLRIDRMLESYNIEKDKLPKGTLSEKRTGNKTYYYLKYREGKKVVSQYIPKKSALVIREQIEHRRHIEIMIQSLMTEQEIARKILEEYV